jgi:arginyl-tRNA synthetase
MKLLYKVATVVCSLPVFDLQKTLSGIAQKALEKKFGDSTDIHFAVSLDEGRGDLTCLDAMQLAKRLRKPPRDVATVIAEAIGSAEGVRSASVAGAGYVNVDLDPGILSSALPDVEKSCRPKKIDKNVGPVIVDYSHPNIAKPLGVHHVLSTVIGQAIVNLHKHLGYQTVSINHIGDWGTQFGKLAVAYQRWGGKPIEQYTLDELLVLYVRFHEEAEKDPAIEELGRKAFQELEQGDEKLRAFWAAVVRITLQSLGTLYERFHVTFDHTQGESFYEDKMAPIIEEGKEKEVFSVGKEGALIATFPEEDKMPPAIVLKGDGSTIYMTRDLATARYRIDTWHPSAILYVVDVAQQMYFKQLFAILHQLKWQLPLMEHTLYGRMSFSDRKMSTRKGNILKLEHVLDEAVDRAREVIRERGDKIQTDDPEGLAEMMGVGALVYGILSQNRKMDMVFDWNKMLSFEGNSAPYLQYTHARALSVLRKSGAKNAPLTLAKELSPAELKLTKLLLLFSETLEAAREERLPHKLTNYLYDVCQAFNSFYNSDAILQAGDDIRSFRLGLTSLTALVLRTGAELLTLRVPERM